MLFIAKWIMSISCNAIHMYVYRHNMKIYMCLFLIKYRIVTKVSYAITDLSQIASNGEHIAQICVQLVNAHPSEQILTAVAAMADGNQAAFGRAGMSL